ncbi:AI-2E family transporter [Tropicibacter naphthalenivorans]|uniref:Transport of quorum-sensing signal protein n=1 Tax=Tropicibacter naphthalenivorans TaxID=441103 RepID=A0A0P1G1H9_9RHOB|nr:AI-2E family transporter [Tropicibacter naphthalenivorans]CUH75654.1 Transport of quorum-sensing signal protein [Tropicibacter naphthalenivorans]SMC42986.1 Predicted PurR-regulated permease PerM [Tropicibacter naphthalenivorans]
MPDLGRSPIQTLSLAVIATVAAIALLQNGQELFAPVTLGLVVAIVLAPMVSRLGRIGVPRAVSATGALFIAIAAIILLLSLVGPVVMDVIAQIPRIEARAMWWLEGMSRSLQGLEPITEELRKSMGGGGQSAMEQAVPTLSEALWMAPNFMGQALIFAGTLFFFLLTRDNIYEAAPAQARTLRQADRAVSHYFTTVTAINAGLGFAVFGVMSLIGLKGAVMWGMAAFLLNFVLYLGPAVLVISLLIAGVTQKTGVAALLPAASYLMLNLTEAQFVTPTLVGHRLRINPLAVFVAIIFGLWLWGPLGGIVALPVMVWIGALLSATAEATTAPHFNTQPEPT